jgi:ribonuclease HI
MSWHYAVRVGRVPGIYPDWTQCQAQVTGFKGAQFKKFATREEADIFMAPGGLPLVSGAWTKAKHKHPKPKESKHKVPSMFDPTVNLPGLTIFTDGSCSGNGTVKARAGAGVYFGLDDPCNLAEPVPLERYAQTSNAGELYAAVRALQVVNGHPDKIYIVSDSTYLVEGMRTRVPKWKTNGKWEQDDLPNRALWHELDALEAAQVQRVSFLWVKGHASCTGNKAADDLADKGRRKHLD